MSDTQGTDETSAAPEAPPQVTAPKGNRRLLWTGIVVVALIALVAVPAFIAVQPAFLQRYPDLNLRYTTWSTSVHKNVSCRACHVPPDLGSQVGYGLRMAGEFYVSLVSPSAKAPVFDRPTVAACEVCHATLVTTSPKGDLKIPHRAHVDVLKVPCAQCHQYLVHELSPEGRHTPTMAACLVCHDGKQAKNACETCHTKKAAPPSHGASDWLVVHPTMVSKIDCTTCHAWTKNWCADCHSRRPPSHTVTWRVDHAAAVNVHRDCEVCHTGSFCITCHGVVPQSNYNPAVTLVK